jgi:hypothetical protein
MEGVKTTEAPKELLCILVMLAVIFAWEIGPK